MTLRTRVWGSWVEFSAQLEAFVRNGLTLTRTLEPAGIRGARIVVIAPRQPRGAHEFEVDCLVMPPPRYD